MKKCSLKQLKRALLGAFVVAILGLATANVNPSLNGKESFINFSLKGAESMANAEDPQYVNHCEQGYDFHYNNTSTGAIEKMETFWSDYSYGFDELNLVGYRISYNDRLTYDCAEWKWCEIPE